MIQGSTAQQLTPNEHAHLSGGRYRVYKVMKDGQWRTLWQIQKAVKDQFNTHYSETTISARLRDLRKARHGGHTVNHRHKPDAPFEYQLEVD